MARTECLLFLLFVACSVSFSSSVVSANDLSLVIGQSTTLQLSPSLPVEKSTGSKPSSVVLCERVQIHGLSRLRNLTKFAHSVKVKVSFINSSARLPNVEVCFHRNRSLGVCMCPQRQWEKLVKGSWVRSMSPFDHKLLDVRMAGSSLEILQVSVEEEFFLYRIIFLVLGIIIMTLASSLSKSLVFYYSSAMAVGIILVILMVLFQGMKLLPTGRKNSVAIFAYSSMVGLGSFLLRYLPRLFHSILAEIGISEDMYNPLAIFLLLFLVIAGAWLGFWVVRKLVLTEDGLIDIGVSHFVAWSIRMIAAVMILQSSVDPLLAAEVLLCGILVSSMLKRITRSRFIRHWYKNLRRTDKSKRRLQITDSSTLGDSYDEYLHTIQTPVTYDFPKFQSRPFRMFACNSSVQGLTRTPPSQMSGSETYYSSFHTTPERRNFTRDEWEKFTKDSTKTALEELVSSPDFSKWAVAHADRITLTPSKDATADWRRRWFLWF
ncbi:Nuclear envelope integral membrane protein [Actinidia chinensis var. chinensis]|uniref:Nuclear envelope integral membrane protein n=1 Tax=Actinidia chinensis var. chinensis TaxID=1590841 RepID=A0A2R6QSP6_ACTCC|nr:Nuclear envelope integral membrane protein [Actinidia chinensis var. chinensis]